MEEDRRYTALHTVAALAAEDAAEQDAANGVRQQDGGRMDIG
jgi:hypothetical protein